VPRKGKISIMSANN